jgi:hypothetical protein
VAGNEDIAWAREHARLVPQRRATASAGRTACRSRFFNDLLARGERLKPLKSWKTADFVDRIVDRNFRSCRRHPIDERVGLGFAN